MKTENNSDQTDFGEVKRIIIYFSRQSLYAANLSLPCEGFTAIKPSCFWGTEVMPQALGTTVHLLVLVTSCGLIFLLTCDITDL